MKTRNDAARKAQRRATALENFTVRRVDMWNDAYMQKKRREFLALGGIEAAFEHVPQRLFSHVPETA